MVNPTNRRVREKDKETNPIKKTVREEEPSRE